MRLVGAKAAPTFVFVTVLLDWLVVGIMSPVFPKLIVDFVGGRMALASTVSGGFVLAFALVFAAVTAHAGSPFVGAPWYCGAVRDTRYDATSVMMPEFGSARR